MRTPLEIPVPTAEELEALDKLYRTTKDVRLRTRAQMVLPDLTVPGSIPAKGSGAIFAGM